MLCYDNVIRKNHQITVLPAFPYAASNYFPRIETREVITFCSFDAGSKTEFTNNSLNSPKIGKLNIDTLIIPQGLSIHEKNPDQKISCYCPFK